MAYFIYSAVVIPPGRYIGLKWWFSSTFSTYYGQIILILTISTADDALAADTALVFAEGARSIASINKSAIATNIGINADACVE